MRLAVLDGITINTGDLSWAPLEGFGDLTVYDRTDPGDTLGRAQGCEMLLTNKVVLGRREIEQLPLLRYIGVLATGYNVVDLHAAAAHGVTVTNVPSYSTDSVAQLVVGHMLNLARGIALHAASVRDGDWVRCPDFVYWKHPLVELTGKTMGIVGFGGIGRAVSKLARALGMRVIVHTRTPDASAGVTFAGLDDLFEAADVVSLHCPLTPETERLVNARRLELMKPTAYLINTGRGPLLDEQAVADALNAGRIAGAAADVLSEEPPRADNPLLSAKNCYLSPHIGWATVEARTRLLAVAAENVEAFLAGNPENVVSA